MKFIGTRGGAAVTGAEAVVRGLAENGGLYVPETLPAVTGAALEEMLPMSHSERAAFILGKFFDEYPSDGLLAALEEGYSAFETEDPAPLVKIENGLFILELFHGPTCADADLSLAVLPYLLSKGREIAGIKEKLLVLTATAGDAGKAALEAFRDAEDVKAAVFYPEEGVSKMQKLQLAAQDGENVDSVGVRGTFDDCQAAVRKILRSKDQRDKLCEKGYLPTTAGTFNFGRLAPRIACYFSAYCDLVTSGQIKAGEFVDFAVPAGNFGSVLAGYYAKRMGLPVGTVVCASNRNNAPSDFFAKGTFERKRPFFRTMSSSLDILLPADLERLLFELSGRDTSLTVERMRSLAQTGKCSLRAEEWKALQGLFYGDWASEEDTVECVYEFFEEFNYPLDPQTGVALHAARKYERKRADDVNADIRPMVVASTASPYKFPQAVFYALTGNDVKDSFKGIKRINNLTAMKVPESLKALRYKPLRFKTVLPPEKIFEEVLSFLS